ncbi:MAG: hypothetical protein R3B93_18990 [Bacteroidia bacterium]
MKQGKKAWSKKYHREYKQERRKQLVQRAIYFSSKEDAEIQKFADREEQTIAEYIREASLIWGRKEFPVSRQYQSQLLALREELALIRHNLDDIKELVRQSYGEDKTKHIELAIDRTIYLDQNIREMLSKPLPFPNS